MNSNSHKCEVRNAESGICSALRAPHSALVARRAFTLTELLIVIVIIGIITGLGLSAMAGAVELAREQRTHSIIAKIDQLIMERYESYRTRAVPLRTAAGTTPRIAAQNRLYALRELMRLEMPDRITDVCYSGTSGTGEVGDVSTDSKLDAIGAANAADIWYLKSVPSLTCTYRRIAKRSMKSSGWTRANQSSECLYLILSTITDGDKNALDFLTSDEIGDTDDDGMKEILDAWGRPIQFLRWAPGYTKTYYGDVTRQEADSSAYPDPFDPLKADSRWTSGSAATSPYALYPLLVSAGRNKVYDMDFQQAMVYQALAIKNDPYNSFTSPLAGQPADADSDGDDSRDNITNHNPVTPTP